MQEIIKDMHPSRSIRDMETDFASSNAHPKRIL